MRKTNSRRAGNSGKPQRYYTELEKQVWSNRPYGCHTLAGAFEHHRASDPKYVKQRQQLESIKESAKRRREWEAIPEWCLKDEHPLKTGRPARLYHRNDYISPLVDALTLIYEGYSGGDALNMFAEMTLAKKQRRKKDGYDDAEEKQDQKRERDRVLRDDPRAKAEEAKRQRDAPAWTCACCGNTDVKTQVQCKDALVCPCGFVVRIGGEFIATHREKLGAEEGEDKTQHADKLYAPRTDKYDMDRVPTVAERRNERKYASQVTKIGGRAKGLGRLCDVQRMCDERASKENLEADVAAGIKLNPKDETKGWNIIDQVNQIARQLAPIEHEVKRELRRQADKLWLTAVRHCRTCTRTDCCELRLVERTPAIIAAAVFETTIERLLHSEYSDVCVTRQHLLDIQMRMQRASMFTNGAAVTQMSTAKAMIDIMSAPDFDPEIICAPTLPEVICASDVGSIGRSDSKPSRHIPFGRNDSSVSCDGVSPTPTDAVVMRDAVNTVFLAHRSELPVVVRDGALRAVQSPGFIEAVKALEDVKHMSVQCIAFCILNAVHREQTVAETGPSFSSAPATDGAFNVAIAMKLGLDLAVAESSIHATRALVPTEAASEASHDDDNDLFS